MTFYIGDVWEVELTVTDPKTKAKVDPASVTYTVTSPALATTAPAAMTRVGVGEYTARTSLTEVGKWEMDVSTSGTYQAARPESITVYEI